MKLVQNPIFHAKKKYVKIHHHFINKRVFGYSLRIRIIYYNSIDIYYNNQRSIKLTKNSIFHVGKKHVEIHHHFIFKRIFRKEIKLYCINTNIQMANIFTKPLNTMKFELHQKILRIQTLSSINRRKKVI